MALDQDLDQKDHEMVRVVAKVEQVVKELEERLEARKEVVN